MNIEPTRAARSDRTVVAGSERRTDPHAVRIAPVDPGERIDVTVRLRPDQPIPDTYAGESRDSFERAHAARPSDIAAVDTFAHDYGLEIGATSPVQRTITLSGSAQQMHEAFGADLAEYQTADQTYRAGSGEISLPSAIAGAVTGVFGLDDRATSKPHSVVADPNANAAGYTPLDVAKSYDFPAGDGTGEHVGVISLGGRYDDGVQKAYLTSLGVPHVPFHVVNVDGGAQRPADPGPTGENTLDAEMIGALVPNADKTIYIAPNTDRGFLDAVSTALHDDHHNTALSISWGGPEVMFPAQTTRAFNELFKEAKAMGVNVFTAAGDNGASDNVGDGNLHTDFPSSSPSVIGTGGTKLTLTPSGTIKNETVWNELAHHEGATGGGVSALEPKPKVQADLPIHGRGVPDVAGNADPTTGYRILEPLGPKRAAEAIVGGTSAVAPLYAALAARIEQNLGHPAGDLQKAIYDAPAGDFHDITTGNNGGYAAAPGWDAATGRGSIRGNAFLETLKHNTTRPTA